VRKMVRSRSHAPSRSCPSSSSSLILVTNLVAALAGGADGTSLRLSPSFVSHGYSGGGGGSGDLLELHEDNQLAKLVSNWSLAKSLRLAFSPNSGPLSTTPLHPLAVPFICLLFSGGLRFASRRPL
jgi:hypothetical protein